MSDYEIDAERGVYVQRIKEQNINFANVNKITSTNDGLKWSFGDNVTNSVLHYKVDGAHTS